MNFGTSLVPSDKLTCTVLLPQISRGQFRVAGVSTFISPQFALQVNTCNLPPLQTRVNSRVTGIIERKNHQLRTTSYLARARAIGSMSTRHEIRRATPVWASTETGLDEPARPASSRRVVVPNPAGEELVGVLAETGSRELVILCHGFRSSKGSGTLAALSAAMGKEGVSTFRFDFSGNGESGGRFSYGNYWKEVEDLRAVVLFFRAQGRSISAILGHSKGGSVVLLYASKYADVPRVVNVSGRYDLRKGVQERLGAEALDRIQRTGQVEIREGTDSYLVTKAGLEDRLSTDMPAAAKTIGDTCRVLTVHGALDKTVPLADAYSFDKVISNHQLKVIDDGDHNFRNCKPQLISSVVPSIVTEIS